ncbi:Nif3-like dinuclear metal center hexameric protein [bacterium]|nr:Nif3-like dinuclear metal center hexameric protein [bacterium]
MNTQEILKLSLQLAEFVERPDDTRIYHPCENVQRILLGIDIDEGDLRDAKKRGYDLVLAHHPPVKVGIEGVLSRHIDLMLEAGVPEAQAQAAFDEHFASLSSRWSRDEAGPSHDDFSKIAKDLNIGFMNIHLPCDEIGRVILQETVDALSELASVADLMTAFAAIPEIAAAGEGVELVSGTSDSPAGRCLVIHAAGTNGGYPVATALYEAGYDTVVYIHLHEEQAERLRAEAQGNLITTGHYGSDSLGINPLVHRLREAGIQVDLCNKMVPR